MPDDAIKLDGAQVSDKRKELAENEYNKTQEDIAKEKENFEEAFDEALGADNKKSSDKTVEVKVDSLARHLRSLFDRRVRERNLLEQKWLKYLRMYKGEYSEEELANMHPNRSKAYIRFARTKIQTSTARMVDLVFPSNGDKNWGIKPTPVPDVGSDTLKLMTMQYEEATGQQLTPEQLMFEMEKIAVQASESMIKEIEDQLTDVSYRSILKQVIKSGCLYGTGILKGPMIKVKKNKKYMPDNDGNWVTLESESLVPSIGNVSIWDFFPDLTAKTIDNCRDMFQRHNMDKSKIIALANRGDFNREAINQHLVMTQGGDFQNKSYEAEIDSLGDVQSVSAAQNQTNKFEVLEYWGFIDAGDLEQLGVEIPDKMKGLQELRANVWILGHRVIKAVVDPLESETWPYYLFYFDKDETSIFGEGIASIMSDVQELMNAAFRAMLDNAAISAGPQIEANLDLLGPDDDPTEIYPFKTWLRTGTGVEAQTEAIRVHTLPSYTNEFIQMANIIERYGDEVTSIPKFLHGGMPQQGGASMSRTTGGLSMVYGNANVTIKDQVKNFDDGITKPFITALYDWNMKFNPKPYIKGDFEVEAKGVSSLIAKEVYSESLIQFANITANPVDQQFINRPEMIREIAKSLDLSTSSLLKSSEQVQAEQQQAAAEAQEQRDFAMHITETARAGGVSPEDLLNQINMLHQQVKELQAQMQSQGQ